jgi:predicted metalloprotease with PDZ domain
MNGSLYLEIRITLRVITKLFAVMSIKTIIQVLHLGATRFFFSVTAALLLFGQAQAQDLKVHVDATNVDQKLFAVEQSFKLRPEQLGKRLTIYFPKWIPGEHGPSGPLIDLSGLQFFVDDQRVVWKRDDIEPFSFHVEIPNEKQINNRSASPSLTAKFTTITPMGVSRRDGAVVSPKVLGLVWNRLLLYPAGKPTAQWSIAASATFPKDWQVASALTVESRKDNTIQFKTVSVDTLVDSPTYAGLYYKRITLDAHPQRPAYLNIFADDAASLETKPEHIKAHEQLVEQSVRLFASRHYQRYEFLLVLSDVFGGKGLEHHESSENAVRSEYFTEWDKKWVGRDLLAHEVTHSWNGKFRRPADLFTPDFHTPMRNNLLWMYEGQTQYWGLVLSARSGMLSQEQVRAKLAYTAAWLDARSGRAWRNLQDTVYAPIIGGRNRFAVWSSWQRGGDYYDEMVLNWLAADVLMRQQGQGSLDQFAQRFFGVEDGRIEPLTYTAEDISKTMAQVQPLDWTAWLRNRLDGYGQGAPLDGLEKSGWRLVYSKEADPVTKQWNENDGDTSLVYSLGISLDKGGRIDQVMWGSPAFAAKLAPGVLVVAVNNLAYKGSVIKDAIEKAKTSSQPIELIIRRGEEFSSVKINYQGGLRYPKLERIEGAPDLLTTILSPRLQ